MFSFLFGSKVKTIKTTRQKEEESEQEYRRTIDEAAKKSIVMDIVNFSDEHAAYALKVLFKRASAEVCIFTDRSMDKEIFRDRDLVGEAINFLKMPSARLWIAYNDPGLKRDLSIVEFLREINVSSMGNKIEIWDANEAFAGEKFLRSSFFLNDQLEFRIKTEDEAILNFGNKEFGLRLLFNFFNIVCHSRNMAGKIV